MAGFDHELTAGGPRWLVGAVGENISNGDPLALHGGYDEVGGADLRAEGLQSGRRWAVGTRTATGRGMGRRSGPGLQPKY